MKEFNILIRKTCTYLIDDNEKSKRSRCKKKYQTI